MSPIPHYGSVVVVGAGTMGAQLACLLASNGSTVRLLDLDAGIAEAGFERARKLKPAALYLPTDARNVHTGGLDDLEEAASRADWVLEAVLEQLEPKRTLLARLDDALAERSSLPIVTTNTSGLSIGALAEGRSAPFKRRFFGTHFFNPARYTRLLELIPLPETDVEAFAAFTDFASRRLGKGTVVANDTPAFIANRLGVHGVLTSLRLAEELELGPDEIDELTGPLIGRPKSATFRTLDLVGIDVAVTVADHCHVDLVDDERRDEFEVPEILRSLVQAGALGDKAGRGFYRKDGDEILALDFATGEYRPRRRIRSTTVELARNEADLGKRLRALLGNGDGAGAFLRRSMTSTLSYAAVVGPRIAESADRIDTAMRWGFGWQLGPFQTLDVVGPDLVGKNAGPDAHGLAAAAGSPPSTYYADECAWDFAAKELRPIEPRPGALDLAVGKRAAKEAGLPSNAAASVLELPDGILGLELHGKLNIIGLETLDIVRRAFELAVAHHDGLVIGTNAADFGAGANLALLLIEAEDGEWGEIDRVLRAFQELNRDIRSSPVPVVAAARGRTLGGAAEMCLAATCVQALTETYIGLVETGIGLIPAGSGATAMARRAAEQLPEGARGDLFPIFRHVFTAVATARVASGAPDAREYLFLRGCDPVTADPDRQWGDAVRTARGLADGGHRTPVETLIPVLGRRGFAAAEALTYNQLIARQISEHDRKVALELARVMSGGDVAEGTLVGERHMLDLERDGFLRLLGERLTRERIRHTLKTGKPLRN